MIKLDDEMLLADEKGYNCAVEGRHYSENPYTNLDNLLSAAWHEGWERATEAMAKAAEKEF